MQIPKVQPTLESLLKQTKNEIEYTINCHRIGSIISFDPETQRAEVQMIDFIYKQNLQNSSEVVKKIVPEPLINVPVQINATLTGGFTFPINAGDFCVLAFNDRDLTNWITTGKTEKIEFDSNRSHSFSDAIAIIGIFPNGKTISNYNNNATEIFYSNQSKISLDNKIGVSNQSGTLLLAIQSLINSINSLGEAIKTAQTIPAQIGVPLTLDNDTQTNIVAALNTVEESLIKFENLLK